MRRPAFFVIRGDSGAADITQMEPWLPFLLLLASAGVLAWLTRTIRGAGRRGRQVTGWSREEAGRRHAWAEEHWAEIAATLRAEGLSDDQIEKLRGDVDRA
jgi:hypothetical protein